MKSSEEGANTACVLVSTGPKVPDASLRYIANDMVSALDGSALRVTVIASNAPLPPLILLVVRLKVAVLQHAVTTVAN